MPTSRTKALAKKLGLLSSKRKQTTADENGSKKRRNAQVFSYLMVIDFESTCWENKKGQQEIIEFPAVLLDLSNGEIVDEFQHYLLPVESPILSHFCKQLTGISQDQVDNGIPLPTCLYLFRQWVDKQVERRGLVMMEPGGRYSEDMQLCSIATWSDWDLGVCLHYECRRKQIRKPGYFNQWVNLRALYKTFYERKPSGVKGSLDDLGIRFTGREHSGIDDSRNTAKLCYRMVKDGCKMIITKSIESKITVVKPPPSSSSHSLTLPNRIPMHSPCPKASKHVSPTIDSELVNKQKFTESAVFKPSSSTTERKLSPLTSETSVSVPVPREEGECHSVDQDSEDSWEGCEADIMKYVIDELDKWEQDGDSVGSIAYMKENSVQAPDQLEAVKVIHPHGILGHAPKKVVTPLLTNVCMVNRQPPTATIQTPCRLQNHITPVTLLPSSVARQSTDPPKTGKTELHCDEASKETSQLPVAVTTIKETPPSELPTHSTPSSKNMHTSSTGNKCLGNSNFKTPSTTQWIRVKQSESNSDLLGPSATSLPSVGSGHKVTPPICGCGKRTKRKCVSNPGPNEGKMFFACPFGRGSNTKKGCGYFKWETHNLLQFLEDHTETCSEYYD